MPMHLRQTINSKRDQKLPTLSEKNKRIIHEFMKDGISNNQYVPLISIMYLIKDERKQNVINYIEAKYPKGYLLVDFDRLEQQIIRAIHGADAATAFVIQKKMLSRDWDGQI